MADWIKKRTDAFFFLQKSATIIHETISTINCFRCLESLETSCREELGGRPATEAMRQVNRSATIVFGTFFKRQFPL